jgi:hypothetical protein
MEYSSSMKVCLQLDIVEYELEGQLPMYDFIIGDQSMHNLGVVLVFKEKTIQIDKMLLPMRNIANLQLKPSFTRVFRQCLSCAGATKYLQCYQVHGGNNIGC